LTKVLPWLAVIGVGWTPRTYVAGARERAFLDEERAVMTAALGDLGLLLAGRAAG
jgi:hypothetical protein